MKKVVIDARMVGPTLHGVARYVTLMAKGLSEKGREKPLPYELVFLVTPGMRIPGFECIEVATPFLSPRELVELPRILSSLGASLYHSPSFSSLWSAPCPWVVTVHDLNHLHYGNVAKRLYYRFLLKRFMSRAAQVMTISNFSRKEITEWSGIPEQKIEIVWNAIEPSLADPVDPKSIEPVLRRYGLERGRYFLCLSNAKPHKNVDLLKAAHGAYWRQAQRAWPLVLTLPTPPQDGIVSVGSLPEFETRALLSAAGAMVFPSLYEGFGLPPVEAAVVGVPIAASRIEPHQEGLQDARPEEVLWVVPRDFHGWVDAFHRLAKNEIRPSSPETRERILRRFSPLALGVSVDRVYRRVLNLSA